MARVLNFRACQYVAKEDLIPILKFVFWTFFLKISTGFQQIFNYTSKTKFLWNLGSNIPNDSCFSISKFRGPFFNFKIARKGPSRRLVRWKLRTDLELKNRQRVNFATFFWFQLSWAVFTITYGKRLKCCVKKLQS